MIKLNAAFLASLLLTTAASATEKLPMPAPARDVMAQPLEQVERELAPNRF